MSDGILALHLQTLQNLREAIRTYQQILPPGDANVRSMLWEFSRHLKQCEMDLNGTKALRPLLQAARILEATSERRTLQSELRATLTESWPEVADTPPSVPTVWDEVEHSLLAAEAALRHLGAIPQRNWPAELAAERPKLQGLIARLHALPQNPDPTFLQKEMKTLYDELNQLNLEYTAASTPVAEAAIILDAISHGAGALLDVQIEQRLDQCKAHLEQADRGLGASLERMAHPEQAVQAHRQVIAALLSNVQAIRGLSPETMEQMSANNGSPGEYLRGIRDRSEEILAELPRAAQSFLQRCGESLAQAARIEWCPGDDDPLLQHNAQQLVQDANRSLVLAVVAWEAHRRGDDPPTPAELSLQLRHYDTLADVHDTLCNLPGEVADHQRLAQLAGLEGRFLALGVRLTEAVHALGPQWAGHFAAVAQERLQTAGFMLVEASRSGLDEQQCAKVEEQVQHALLDLRSCLQRLNTQLVPDRTSLGQIAR